MSFLEPRECLLPNQLFRLVYLLGILMLGSIAVLDHSQSGQVESETIILMVIYALVGSLLLLKRISILICPSWVLIKGIGIAAVLAVMDVMIF